MIISILLHVVVFLVLGHFKIGLNFSKTREIATAPINVQQVEVHPTETTEWLPPEAAVLPPSDASALVDEVDFLAKLPKDQDIDIKPDVLQPEYALKMTNPAREGEPASMALDRSAGMEIEADLPTLGRMEESVPPAAVGQVTVDPGAVQADDVDLTKFTDNLLKNGAKGKVREGALDGVASLDALIGLPPNVLVGMKTMLPSDLLFEFNSANLRESAKVGLMKLGLLMDRNPNLYCWIEGHTDMVGGDEFNLDLSRRRATAVRDYLVKSLRMDENKILTRGKGKVEPLVLAGNVDEQAPNRRVEIRMRKTLPPPESEPAVPRAVLVSPDVEPPLPQQTVKMKPKPGRPPVKASTKPPQAKPPQAKPPQAKPPQAKLVKEDAEADPMPRAVPVAPKRPLDSAPPPAIPRARVVEE